MHSCGGARRKTRRQDPASLTGHAKCRSEDGSGRRRPQAHDQSRPNGFDLRLEPRPARGDLGGIGLLVDTPFPARLPLEVLDRVGDVNVLSIDSGFGQTLVEEPTSRADERMPLEILAIARLLADQQEPGARPALPENGLGRALPERAGAAAGGSSAKRRQGSLARQGRRTDRRGGGGSGHGESRCTPRASLVAFRAPAIRPAAGRAYDLLGLPSGP